jgi:hypothetical protein
MPVASSQKALTRRFVDPAGWGHPAFTGSCQFRTPEALKRVARGREAHPGKRRKGSPTLEGLQEGAGIFAPPSGCVRLNMQDPG